MLTQGGGFRYGNRGPLVSINTKVYVRHIKHELDYWL